MSLIVKTGSALPPDELMVVNEKVAVGTPLGIGSEIFVWTAETQGGSGLVAVGEVEAVGPADSDRRRSITVRLLSRSPAKGLGKADLVAHDHRVNEGAANTPVGRLAAKLYGHSLNRVVELDEDEAHFLREHF